VQYINIAGPIPENPFGFDDGLLLMTEDELQAMDLSTLTKYSLSLSTSISLETSTLIQNQNIGGLYTLLKGLSQSTIDGLNTEIILNRGLIQAYSGIQEGLDALSTTYISSIRQFDLEIAMQEDLIDGINTKLFSYSREYENSLSSIALENAEFISSATQYSTFYWTYQAYQDALDAEVANYADINSKLSSAILREQNSFAALQSTGMVWSAIGHSLSSLYTDRSNITSTLTRYRINEGAAYITYMSSIAGLTTASSIYAAALTTEQYALSLSTTTRKITEYANAQNLFNQADALYQASIPQGGGGPTGPTVGIRGNSALWAARSMAQQSLQMALNDKSSSETETSTLMATAGIQNLLAYETTLLGYDTEIQSYFTVQLQFQGYKASSLQAVTQFSSIYEQSLTDISTYTRQVSMYSSFYESSMSGASSLLGLSQNDQSTIQGEYLTYMALSRSISTLNDEYIMYSEEYTSSIAASTLFAGQYYSSSSNVSYYTTIYNSTTTSVESLRNQIYGPGGLMGIYSATQFTNSSLLNTDVLAQKIYDTQIMDLVNSQDLSMYEYRETFCRTTQIGYQTAYDTSVLAAVQQAQAQAVAQGTTTPITNLNTPIITTNYSNITSINTFLSQFSNIYTSFATQTLTLSKISTSVGYESEALSTTMFYTTAQYFGTPRVPNVGSLVAQSGNYLTLNQKTTETLLGEYSNIQANINSQKTEILSGLSNYYTWNTIKAQETEISSFILKSLTDAENILASQGLVQSFIVGTPTVSGTNSGQPSGPSGVR